MRAIAIVAFVLLALPVMAAVDNTEPTPTSFRVEGDGDSFFVAVDPFSKFDVDTVRKSPVWLKPFAAGYETVASVGKSVWATGVYATEHPVKSAASAVGTYCVLWALGITNPEDDFPNLFPSDDGDPAVDSDKDFVVENDGSDNDVEIVYDSDGAPTVVVVNKGDKNTVVVRPPEVTEESQNGNTRTVTQ